ncbi:type IV secretory system conjugative DNA transfer family protein [Paracoccus sp. SM22M-07]|uniref:type IV secretory system conjugative DNA transfer family protein n=1 Tax=Paracoccus sp. SM22M-07 TaxID=1520813 RepID=UPI000930574B|nr:type IV secretory system conjugative DNA transfer family protein [Paracoccus sp. SM22M-07]
MAKLHLLGGVLLFALIGTALAYVAATGWLTYIYTGSVEYIDWTMLAKDYLPLRTANPQAFKVVNLIWGGFIVLSLLFSAKVLTEGLTTFGKAHWQSRRELKANKFFAMPGKGFVVGKMGSPKGKAKFLCSASFPHCLLVAPTGAGKGVGFVIPNLLLFKGSAVVLDVKGENFDFTSRHRQKMGDKIWRFAPLDWSGKSHRYNPLERIYELDNADQQQMEIKLLAELFLQADDESAKGLLEGGIDLFVACGLFAIERGTPTLGEIYRLAASGGDKQKQYLSYAEKVQNKAAKLMFERLASTNDKTLTSYLSLLMTSGLGLWSNPAIDRATSTSDFNFRDFRRTPQTAYFVAPPHDKIRAVAPLVRLFFSDLLSSLHSHLPGKDEPWPVMIMLDEFDMLGKMPSVTDSIKTLRAYGGNLAIVTQTIPALDKIYGEDTRLSLQGGAGVKIYLAPSEQRTKSELSSAVGKTTHRVTSKSKTVGKGPFSGVNVSERNEERDLLTEDEAGRLSPDTVVVLANGQHPIKAKRIKYYEDRTLRPIFEAQEGPLPELDAKEHALRELREDLAKHTSQIEVLSTELGKRKAGLHRSRAKQALSIPDFLKEQRAELPAAPQAEEAPKLVRKRKKPGLEGMQIKIDDPRIAKLAVEELNAATAKVNAIQPDTDGDQETVAAQ